MVSKNLPYLCNVKGDEPQRHITHKQDKTMDKMIEIAGKSYEVTLEYYIHVDDESRGGYNQARATLVVDELPEGAKPSEILKDMISVLKDNEPIEKHAEFLASIETSEGEYFESLMN